MTILLLTSIGLRHFALAQALGALGEVTMIAETRRPLLPAGPAMQEYLARMTAAEAEVFGSECAAPSRVHVRPFGTFSACPLLGAGVYQRIVVFGASWIQGPMAEDLIAHDAVNLHAGMAPEYRGSACNFWADYDGHPELVGMTIHRLARGLDTGPILARVTAAPDDDPWRRSMRVVAASFEVLLALLHATPVPPGHPQAEISLRVARHRDFTEAVCAEYLARQAVPA